MKIHMFLFQLNKFVHRLPALVGTYLISAVQDVPSNTVIDGYVGFQ